MEPKKRIVTEYPFWPLLTYEQMPRRTFYLAGGLCRLLYTRPGCINSSIFLYSRIKKYLPKKMTVAMDLCRLDRQGYEDVYFIVWGNLKEKAYLVSKIGKKASRKIIMDFTEDDYQYCKTWGSGHTGFKDFEDYKRTMRKILNTVDYATVEGAGFVDEWGKLGFNIENLIEILNASDPKLFQVTPLPQEKNILFLKNGLTKKWANIFQLDMLIEAFKIVSKEIPEAKLTIMYIADQQYLQRLRKEHADLNIEFMGSGVPYICVPGVISKSYMCINAVSKLDYHVKYKKTYYKLFDYMAAGRPIVNTESSDFMADFFKNEKCGLMCKSTPEDMAEKIIKLFKDKEYATKLGLNGRKAIEQRHSWDLRAQEIYEKVFS